MFILKLVCCIGGTVILAGVVTAFMNWWEARPIVEERSTPLYIKKEIPYNELD